MAVVIQGIVLVIPRFKLRSLHQLFSDVRGTEYYYLYYSPMVSQDHHCSADRHALSARSTIDNTSTSSVFCM